LITGAADGIGFAYVREFAKMKFNLILVDIQEDKLNNKKKHLLQ
jgi:short-subunit dehydrogenase